MVYAWYVKYTYICINPPCVNFGKISDLPQTLQQEIFPRSDLKLYLVATAHT